MVDFDKMNDLVPVIVQDENTKEVLMLGYTNLEAFELTLSTGNAWYYSRSRNKLWMKGESSGNTQKVKQILTDCDEDTLIFIVKQNGGASCHLGYKSCFFREVTKNGLKDIDTNRIFDPKDVYNK